MVIIALSISIAGKGPEMLDVRRMRVLCEVAAEGSFSAAAASLGYTQSAVSQQIAALEAEVGQKLVRRERGGPLLTTGGAALVAHAEVVIARISDAEQELALIGGNSAGRLRVAAFSSAAATLLPFAVARFCETMPQTELNVTVADPDDSVDLMRRGEIDMALILEVPDSSIPEYPGIDTEPIVTDAMHLVLPLRHPLVTDPEIELAVLSSENWIMGSKTGVCPDARVFMKACADADFDPKVAFHSEDYPAIQGLVAAGLGVSLIPELALSTVRDDVLVRRLSPTSPTRQVSAATLEGSWSSPVKRAMFAALQASAKASMSVAVAAV